MTNFAKHPLSIVLFITTMVLTIPSCTEDYFDLDRMQDDTFVWNPDLAIPLVFSSLTAADIVGYDENNYYDYGDDNFITLIYTRTVLSETLNEFLEIPVNQSIQQNISLTSNEIAAFNPNNPVNKSVSTAFPFIFNGTTGNSLNRVVFESGTMSIFLMSDFQHSGTLNVSMPELRLNGVAFNQNIPINYTGGLVSQNIVIDLNGYEMDIDNGGPNNSLPITYTLTLNDGGNTTSTGQAVSITHGFNDLILAFADGNFGQFELEIPAGQVALDLLDGGALYFEDPRLRLIVTNSLGVGIEVTVQSLYGEGESGILNFNYANVMNSPFTIAPAPSLGDSSVQSFYFNKDNSNIAQVVNGYFNTLHHDFNSTVNPGPQTYNFAARNSRVEVKAEAELPFWGKSNHFIIEDTLEYPLGELSDLQGNIERGLLRINTVNGFPMDGILKLYLTDSAYNVIDSILADGSYVLRSGPIDANGKVISPVNTNNDIPIDSARVASIFGAKYMIIQGDMTSTNNAADNIRIYGDDLLQVRIGLQVKFKGQLSDLDGL